MIHADFAAVETRYGHRVEAADLATHDPMATGEHCGGIEKVIWKDGTFSWGKAWYFAGTSTIARVGAGAYGSMEVWTHPDYARLEAEALKRPWYGPR